MDKRKWKARSYCINHIRDLDQRARDLDQRAQALREQANRLVSEELKKMDWTTP